MLTGKPACLRAWREEDIPALLALRNDTTLQEQLMTQPRPNSMETAREWLSRRSAGPENVFFVIEDTDTREVGGYLQYTNLDTLNGTCEFGICIAPAFHGRGHAAAAMHLGERYLLEVFNIRKVMLKVFDDNARAIRLYVKQGYQKCGLLKQHFLRGGQYRDVAIMEKFVGRSES